MLPIERIDPTEPIDKIEPLDPMERIDPTEPMLSNDIDEPMLAIDANERTLSTLTALPVESRERQFGIGAAIGVKEGSGTGGAYRDGRRRGAYLVRLGDDDGAGDRGRAMNRFRRTVEDFTCAHCGVRVTGDGYTNHCPQCLWSCHVDVIPGDRDSDCGGLMEPLSLRYERETFSVVHRCVQCGYERPNRVHEQDDPDAVRALLERTGTI